MQYEEAIRRYAFPRIQAFFKTQSELDPDQAVLTSAGIRKEGKVFNSGFDQIKEICNSIEIQMIVYLHAEKNEAERGEYNKQGQEIIAWCHQNQVKIIQELDHPFTNNDYRDKIHITNSGQRKLAMRMIKTIREILNDD